MAAFDLPVVNPGTVNVAPTLQSGARNLMDFMRQQQNRKNQEDTLAMQQANMAANHMLKKEGLALDKTRTDNQQANFLANQKIAQDGLAYEMGADQRAVEKSKRLFEAIEQGRKGVQGEESTFSLSEGTLQQLHKNKDFLAMTIDERNAFIESQQNLFRGMRAEDIGPAFMRDSIIKSLAGTGESYEEIMSIADKEVNARWKDSDAAQIAHAKEIYSLTGGGSGGSKPRSGKNLAFDNTGEFLEQQKYTENFINQYDVENSKSGKVLFNGLRKLLDRGGQDLNRPNLQTYMDGMLTNFNIPAPYALNALKSHIDDDALENNDAKLEKIANAGTVVNGNELSKDEFMNTDLSNTDANANQRILQKVYRTATSLQIQQQGGSSSSSQSTGNNASTQKLLSLMSNYQSPQQRANSRRAAIVIGNLPKRVQETVTNEINNSSTSKGEKSDLVAVMNDAANSVSQKVGAAGEQVSPEQTADALAGSLSDSIKKLESGLTSENVDENSKIIENIKSLKEKLSNAQKDEKVKEAKQRLEKLKTGHEGISYDMERRSLQNYIQRMGRE